MNELDLTKYKELYKAPFEYVVSTSTIIDYNGAGVLLLGKHKGLKYREINAFGHWLVSKLNEEWEKK